MRDRILICSGDSPLRTAIGFDPRTDTAESYDPPTGSPRSRFALVPHGGRAYLVGGRRLADSVVVGEIERFDPVARLWSVGTALGAAREDAAAWSGARGSSFLAGGLDAAATTRAEVFRFDGSTWASTTALPSARASSRAGGNVT